MPLRRHAERDKLNDFVESEVQQSKQMLNPEVFALRTLTKAAVVTVELVGGFAVTANAQYYNYYGAPYTYSWSPYNYPGYQTSVASNPYYYYYPGYGYTYNYPTYDYYVGAPYPAPKAYWDPYVGFRPYSDDAGPKASGYGGS